MNRHSKTNMGKRARSRLVGAIGIVAGLAAGTAQAAIIDQWTFNEGSGTEVLSTGTLGTTGTVFGAAWVATPGGSGLSFAGATERSDNIVRFLNSSGWADGLGARSVEMWLQSPALGYPLDGAVHDVLVKTDQGASKELYLGVVNGAMRNVNTIIDATDLSGPWHQVVYVSDGSDAREYIYIDGALALTEVNPPRALSIANGGELDIGGLWSDFWQGNNGLGVREGFVGVIDEITVHNLALSPGDVLARFQAGPIAQPIPEPGVLALAGVGLGLIGLRRRKL